MTQLRPERPLRAMQLEFYRDLVQGPLHDSVIIDSLASTPARRIQSSPAAWGGARETSPANLTLHLLCRLAINAIRATLRRHPDGGYHEVVGRAYGVACEAAPRTIASVLGASQVPSTLRTMGLLHEEQLNAPLDPRCRGGSSAWLFFYAMAKAGWNPPIWRLEDSAFDALLAVDLRPSVVAQRLPRIPHGCVHVVLPGSRFLEGSDPEYPKLAKNPLRSFLLREEIPGELWQVVCFHDSPKLDPMEFHAGPLRLLRDVAELESDDREFKAYGMDVVWKLMLNLMLFWEHQRLTRTPCTPKLPTKPRQLRRLLERGRVSDRDFLTVDLAGGQLRSHDGQTDRAPSSRKSTSLHEVGWHWNSYWVSDPEGEPTYGLRKNDKGTQLWKVARLIAPFERGSGPRKQRRVVASGSLPDLGDGA